MTKLKFPDYRYRMGVSGLFKKCTFRDFKENVQRLKNAGVKTIGVDMYVLLHKFCLDADVVEVLAYHPEQYHSKMYERIKNYLLDFINLGFDLFLVYDGNKMKYKITEEDRARARIANYMKGNLAGSIEVVPKQMFNFQHYIEELKIPFVVAPFEADAQLAYLFKRGTIQCVLTNDSDLIIYGVTKIIFIRQKGLDLYEHEKIDEKAEEESINQMNLEKLWLFGYMIGCDYFKGIPQLGIMKAFKIIAQLKLVYENTKIDWESTVKLLASIPDYAKATKKIMHLLPENTLESAAEKVRMVFHSQPVFDPMTYELKYLNDTPVLEKDRESFGIVYDNIKVGKGIVDPSNGKEYQLDGVDMNN